MLFSCQLQVGFPQLAPAQPALRSIRLDVLLAFNAGNSPTTIGPVFWQELTLPRIYRWLGVRLCAFIAEWVCTLPRCQSPPLAAIDQKISFCCALSLSRSMCAPLSLTLSVCAGVCVCISSFVSMCASCCLYLLLDLPPSALPLFRSVSAAERCLAPIGRPGLRRADTTLAVSAGAAR